MRTIDWLVLLAAAALIAWVNWYFFIASRSGSHASVSDDARQ